MFIFCEDLLERNFVLFSFSSFCFDHCSSECKLSVRIFLNLDHCSFPSFHLLF